MTNNATQWSQEEFTQKLRGQEENYHIYHPFSVAMHEGKLTKEQMRGWVLNRFYYQICLPRKDGAILANCPNKANRKQWLTRILNQDGYGKDAGGIEAWVQLARACGINETDLWSEKYVIPNVRFAVDAYVNFAKNATWQEAVCSSLTELFAPKIHQQRVDNWPENYPWIDQSGLTYFQSRLKQAPNDVEHGLAVVLENFITREEQERALKILQFKLDVLWSMLDAISWEYDFPVKGKGGYGKTAG